MDTPTAHRTRMSKAQICVEIDLRAKRVPEIILRMKGSFLNRKSFMVLYLSSVICAHM